MIERIEGLSGSEFTRRFKSQNQPVVLIGQTGLQHITPAYLADLCGDQLVPIMTGRDDNPAYEKQFNKHVSQLPMREYVEIVQTYRGNDCYMVARNNFFQTEGGRALLRTLPAASDHVFQHTGVNMWFGPAGTRTPLHFDTLDILLAQVYGRKRVKLFDPGQSANAYNRQGVYSEVDIDEPDLDAHPLFGQIVMEDFFLNAGETLFLPVGWWHSVRSLSPSISLSFTNFLS